MIEEFRVFVSKTATELATGLILEMFFILRVRRDSFPWICEEIMPVCLTFLGLMLFSVYSFASHLASKREVSVFFIPIC